MCDAKPGLRCATDTRVGSITSSDTYRAAHPEGPGVDPLSSAASTFAPTYHLGGKSVAIVAEVQPGRFIEHEVWRDEADGHVVSEVDHEFTSQHEAEQHIAQVATRPQRQAGSAAPAKAAPTALEQYHAQLVRRRAAQAAAAAPVTAPKTLANGYTVPSAAHTLLADAQSIGYRATVTEGHDGSLYVELHGTNDRTKGRSGGMTWRVVNVATGQRSHPLRPDSKPALRFYQGAVTGGPRGPVEGRSLQKLRDALGLEI